jgi:hypothetical protein
MTMFGRFRSAMVSGAFRAACRAPAAPLRKIMTRPFHLPALLALLSLLGGVASAAPAPAIWNIGPIAASDLQARTTALEAGAAPLPPVIHPAVEFQKILLRIATYEPMATWRPDVEKFAKATGEDPMTKALRELALCWEARARMQEIDKALRLYYGRTVVFPDSLDEVKGNIPADAKTDPWDGAWVYKTAAPANFAKLLKQRYQLGPARYPRLTTIKEFIASPSPALNWKVSPRTVGGNKALEIRTPEGSVAVVQAGGRIADATLAFIGEGWALLATSERLVTVNF